MSACIFPGRFQPFHTGHLLVVKGMAQSCGRPIIAICHGDAREDDLFSLEEVRSMITASLLEENIVDATIVDVSDCDSDDEWMDKLLEAVENPAHTRLWTGEEEMKALAQKHGLEVQNISPVPGFNGTHIRAMIEKNDTTWREKVPGGTMEVVDDKFMKQE